MYVFLGDTGIRMYEFLGVISVFSLVIYNIFQINRKNIELGKMFNRLRGFLFKKSLKKGLLFFAVVESIITSAFQNALVAQINVSFGDLVGTGGNYFGLLYFGPFILFLWFYIAAVNPLKYMDLITPAYALALITVKLSCFCAGCCGGIQCSWGLYFPSKDVVMFPSQLLECGLALVIFIFLLFYKKKAKEGTLFPVFMILYSGTRFFAEFLRGEENVFWILKTYHILCIIGVVVGCIWLFIAYKFSDKILEFYSKAPFPWVRVKKRDYREKKKTPKKVVYNKNGALPSTGKKKVGHPKLRMWILLWSLGLMGQIGWNVESMWFNTFVYEKIDKNPSIITPMIILSALATVFSIFFFGTLSDRTGKRRTLISTGFILWGVLVIGFGMTQFLTSNYFTIAIVGVVVGDMLVSFFASMSTDVGFSAWTTDIMKTNIQGKIGAAIAVQSVLGTLLGNVIGGYIVGQENNYLRLFVVVGSVLTCFGVISAYMFTKKDDITPSIRGTFKEQFFSVFDFKNVFKNKELLCVNLVVSIFFTGFYTYFTHFGNYLIHYLGFSPDKMGIVQAVPLVLSMLVTLPVSNLINKDKFIHVSITSIVSGLIGVIFLFPIMPESIDPTRIFQLNLFLGVFFIGASFVVMLQNTKIWTKKLYPQDSKGQYEGLWAVSYILIPMTLSSIISQNVIKLGDGSVLNELTGQMEYIPDGSLILVGVIISSFSIIPVILSGILGKKNKVSDKKIKTKK